MRNDRLTTFKEIQKQPSELFYEKAVLKNFAIFTGWTGKYLCWSLFLIQSTAKFLRPPILINICERRLLKMCSWNREKLKIILYIKKQVFSTSISEISENVCFYHDWIPIIFLWCGEKETPKNKYLLELIKRRS